MRLTRNITLAALAVWSVGAAGCKLKDPTGLRSDDVLAIRIDSGSLTADSVSRTAVTINLTNGTSMDADVVLHGEGGRFVGADAAKPGELHVKAGASLVHAIFVAGVQPGLARLSATVGSIVVDSVIDLRPARPSAIFLTGTPLTAKADGVAAITLTAALIRAEFAGTVSYGTRVDFIVSDSLGVEFPEQRSSLSFSGAATPLVRRLSSQTPATYVVEARVGQGASAIRSNRVRVTFTP
jgi:hypothetical protein